MPTFGFIRRVLRRRGKLRNANAVALARRLNFILFKDTVLELSFQNTKKNLKGDF